MAKDSAGSVKIYYLSLASCDYCMRVGNSTVPI